MTTPDPQPLGYDKVKHLLEPRPSDAHKGHFGHVLVIGGDRGYGGAVFMAAESAARAGAGLVTVATHPGHALAYLPRRPELMCQGLQTAEGLDGLLDRATVLVLGPGLGQSPWSISLFNRVLQAQTAHEKPMVMDADALNLLAQGHAKEFRGKISKCVLTPHPGEAGRLLGTGTAAIQADRVGSVLALHELYRGTIVLKGAGTLVTSSGPGGEVLLERCEHGNPGMATGGMGDVLTGVVAGVMAQGLEPRDAARLGVCAHALAGDRCAAQDGQRGLLATDLLPHVRSLLNPSS